LPDFNERKGLRLSILIEMPVGGYQLVL